MAGYPITFFAMVQFIQENSVSAPSWVVRLGYAIEQGLQYERIGR